MKTLIMIRMMRFVEKLKTSEKPVLRQLLRLTMKNTQSVTGRNMRGILLMTKKSRVEDLTEEDARNIQYHSLDDTEQWRIVTMTEVLEIKSGMRELPEEWSWQQKEDWLNYCCNPFTYLNSLMDCLNRIK